MQIEIFAVIVGKIQRYFVTVKVRKCIIPILQLENWNDALSYFDRYEIALNFTNNHSENFYLHYGRAMTMAERGECNLAIDAIDDALGLSGPIDYNAELYKKRALCNLTLDNLAEAKQDLSKARTIFNGIEALHNTQWHLELDYIAGLVAFKDNRFEQAFEFIHRYYKDFLELQRLNNSEYVTQVQTTMEASIVVCTWVTYSELFKRCNSRKSL